MRATDSPAHRGPLPREGGGDEQARFSAAGMTGGPVPRSPTPIPSSVPCPLPCFRASVSSLQSPASLRCWSCTSRSPSAMRLCRSVGFRSPPPPSRSPPPRSGSAPRGFLSAPARRKGGSVTCWSRPALPAKPSGLPERAWRGLNMVTGVRSPSWSWCSSWLNPCSIHHKGHEEHEGAPRPHSPELPPSLPASGIRARVSLGLRPQEQARRHPPRSMSFKAPSQS